MRVAYSTTLLARVASTAENLDRTVLVSSYREARTDSRIEMLAPKSRLSIELYRERPRASIVLEAFCAGGIGTVKKHVPWKRLRSTSCPPAQAPPKKALLSREQFEDGVWEDRDGQIPIL